jgi:hypothetical protein
MTDLSRYIAESEAAAQRDWLDKVAKHLRGYDGRLTLTYVEQDDKIEVFSAGQQPDDDAPMAFLLLEAGDDNDSAAGVEYLAERLARILFYTVCPACGFYARECVCAGHAEPLSAWESNNVSLGLNRDGSV